MGIPDLRIILILHVVRTPCKSSTYVIRAIYSRKPKQQIVGPLPVHCWVANSDNTSVWRCWLTFMTYGHCQSIDALISNFGTDVAIVGDRRRTYLAGIRKRFNWWGARTKEHLWIHGLAGWCGFVPFHNLNVIAFKIVRYIVDCTHCWCT